MMQLLQFKKQKKQKLAYYEFKVSKPSHMSGLIEHVVSIGLSGDGED